MGDPVVTFSVLGPLELSINGRPVAVPTGRSRSVLAALVLRRGHMVSSDALIETALGGQLPVDPSAALYTVISRLRSVLGARLLKTGPGGYVLVLPRGRLDVDRFEELRARASRSTAALAARLLDEALELWRGDAYQEFADQDFARAEAARLDELRLATGEERAAIGLELGEIEQTVAWLGAFVNEHPYREKALGLLMRGLSQSGRIPEALAAYRNYRKTLAEELGLDPSPSLESLHSRILGNGSTTAFGPRRARFAAALSQQLTSFTGRERETAQLLELVLAHPLVSVVGPGGVGKTRLVIEAFDVLQQRTGLSPVLVDLASVARESPRENSSEMPDESAPEIHATAVSAVISAALGLERRQGLELAGIVEALHAVPCLLVLDNCEHIRAEVGALATVLARSCPSILLVVTSRARLGLPHEHVMELAPLEVPAAGAEVSEIKTAAAVRLFVERVRAGQSDVSKDAGTWEQIAELVRHLDGLPLAIEFAARRASVLGLTVVLQRLKDGLDLLSGGRPGRQESLRHVMDWSWELLTPSARKLLEALSVFAGGFDVAAAEALRPGDRVRIDLDLAELVECSMITVTRSEPGNHYRLLETVRAYAGQRLASSDSAKTAVAWAHVRWAAELAERFAAAASGVGAMPDYMILDRARNEFAAAVRCALAAGRPELAATITGPLALVPHWRPGVELWQLCIRVARDPQLHGSPTEPLALGAAAMAAVEAGELAAARELATRARNGAFTPRERYLAGLTLGITCLYTGDYDVARTRFTELLSMKGLSEGNRAELYSSVALVNCYAGNLAAAHEAAAAAREAVQGAGPGAVRAFVTYASGEVLALQEPTLATAVLREAVSEAERVGADHVALVARIGWLAALERLGEHRRALAMARPLLESQLSMGNWPQLWTTLRTLAMALASTGRPALAQFLLAAADASSSAPALVGPDAQRHRELRKQLDERLGAKTARKIAALAASMPRGDVINRTWTILQTNAPID